MAKIAPFRVRLWNIGASRGRGDQVASIDDAIDVGVSAYANDAGEMFFTLPMNHPQIGECLPWERHYEVSRRTAAGAYDIVGTGLLDDYDATANEVVFYGTDSLGLLGRVLTPSTTYTSQLIGTVITDQFTQAKDSVGQPNNLFQAWSAGAIDATSRTVTVLTVYEPKLQFFKGVLDFLQAGGTTRPIVSVSRSYPFTFSFDDNKGSDKRDVRLEYGGAVNDFRYRWGGGTFITATSVIGIKREGAVMLTATAATPTTDMARYGRIMTSTVYTDVINQAELQSRSNAYLADLYFRSGSLLLSLAQGYVVPWDGWDLGDSVPAIIDRGIVSIDALYTIWGMEWIGRKDGSESMFLNLQPKLV